MSCMRTRIEADRNHNLKALVLNEKDGLMMTIDKIINDPLPSNGYRVHFYKLDITAYQGADLRQKFAEADNSIIGNEAQELLNTEIYFYKHRNGKIEPFTHKVDIVSDLRLYGDTEYHAKNMLKGFFNGHEFRRFIKTHDRKYQLEKKLDREQDAVREHQRRAEAIKKEL